MHFHLYFEVLLYHNVKKLLFFDPNTFKARCNIPLDSALLKPSLGFFLCCNLAYCLSQLRCKK